MKIGWIRKSLVFAVIIISFCVFWGVEKTSAGVTVYLDFVLEEPSATNNTVIYNYEIPLEYDEDTGHATGQYVIPTEYNLHNTDVFLKEFNLSQDGIQGLDGVLVYGMADEHYNPGDTWDIDLDVTIPQGSILAGITEGMTVAKVVFTGNYVYKNIVTLNYYAEGMNGPVYHSESMSQRWIGQNEFTFDLTSSHPVIDQNAEFMGWTTDNESEDPELYVEGERITVSPDTATWESDNWVDGSSDAPCTAGVSLFARYGYFVRTRFVDEDGNEIRESEGELYLDGTLYSIEVPEIAGFTAPVLSQAELEGRVNGAPVTKTLVYSPLEYELTTRFVDEEGNALAEEIKTRVYSNHTYQTTPREVTGYSVKVTPENATGRMPGHNETVTYIYEKNKYTITVIYVKEDSVPIRDSTNKLVEYGASYSIEKEKIVGYVLKETQGDTTGIMPAKNISIEFMYSTRVYTIEYDLNGGVEGKINPTTYTVENTITLNKPYRAGYTFLGWTGSNGDTPDKSVSIAKGSTGNKKYKANWKKEKENDNEKEEEDKPDDNAPVVKTSGETNHFSKGTKYRLDGGRWTINGDATLYPGDLDFYVGDDISLTFNQVNN